MKSLLIYPVYTEHLSNLNTKIGSREIRIRLVSLCIVHVVLGFTISYNHIEMKNSKFSDIFSFLFTYLYNIEDGFFLLLIYINHTCVAVMSFPVSTCAVITNIPDKTGTIGAIDWLTLCTNAVFSRNPFSRLRISKH